MAGRLFPRIAMHRGEALRLAVTCVLLLVAAVCCSAPSEVNLALRRSFTTSGGTYGNWSGLVDGVSNSDRAPYCFATDASSQFPKWVVIDLGGMCRISKVNVFNSYNGNVKTVGLYSSTDGQKYQSLRDEYIFPKGHLQTLTHSFPAREARFVKIAFADTYGGGYGGDYYMFLREVEVWGQPAATQPLPGAATRPRTDPVPRWLRMFRHYALRNGADLNLVVLADSVGAPAPGADDVRPFGELVADLLTERITDATPGPGGTGGGKVRVTALCEDRLGLTDCLTRLDQEVVARNPDIVVVAFGLWASLRGDQEGFRDRLNELVGRLLGETHAAVLLVTPPPVLADPGKLFYPETRRRNSAWAADTVHAIGQLNDLPVLDLARAFKETELPLAQLYDDNLHLNNVGHTVIAERLAQLLQ